MTVAAAAELEWWANLPAAERHAFPRHDGYRRAMCGIRWTPGYGHQGTGYCIDCMQIITAQLRVLNAALESAGDRA